MSQDQADIPAYLRPTTCGTGDNAVTVYPLDARTTVMFCRKAQGNLPDGQLRSRGSFVDFVPSTAPEL